jgi:hypothetical protein
MFSVERRFIMGEEAREDLGTVRHTELFGGWPLGDFFAGEADPSFDALEHLDLKCCEQNGEVCAFWERMTAVEVRRHEFNDRSVVFADVGFEFVESPVDVFNRPVVGE